MRILRPFLKESRGTRDKLAWGVTVKTIFDSITVGDLQLPNRIFMSPLTRGRADPGGIPNELMAVIIWNEQIEQ